MAGKAMAKMPPWVLELLLQLLKQLLSSEEVKALLYKAKDAAVSYLKDLAKKSETKLDDAMVSWLDEKLEEFIEEVSS